MGGPRQSDDAAPVFDAAAGTAAAHSVTASATGPAPAPGLREPELDAALQLLVERAQYITGATGTALALPQGNELVCRASAGSCAPAIGARLQVRSGLTGESIARRQLLRCDNAETDPRVNLEACRALGIASMVVLPLLRQNGEVRGLFELFSDHAYAFEERDLLALERMADLTITALDLAEQRHGAVPPTWPGTQPESGQARKRDGGGAAAAAGRTLSPVAQGVPLSAVQISVAMPCSAPTQPTRATEPEKVSASTAESQIAAQTAAPTVPALPESAAAPARAIEPVVTSPPVAASAPVAAIPDAIRRVQKCEGCGFPISEGRTLCVDCERKREKLRDQAQDAGQPAAEQAAEPAAAAPDASLPPFLAKAAPVKESWLANHVNLLAIVVLILGVLVVIVVFR